MSSAQALAVRTRSQPTSGGSPEKPYPGREGRTRWKASSALPRCAVGSVSGPTESIISMTEPGQPCVMISGSAFSCGERTWMKWMSTPSILRHELRECVQPRFDPPQVVVGDPVGRELLNRRRLHALRPIFDELFGGQARRRYALAKVLEGLIGNGDAERT